MSVTVKRVAVLTERVAALVAEQVDLDDPGTASLRPHRPWRQGLPGMVTVPAGRRAQLIQDQTLAGLAGPLVPSRVRLRDRLPLRHRQSDHPPNGPGATGPQARPTRVFLRESTNPLRAHV